MKNTSLILFLLVFSLIFTVSCSKGEPGENQIPKTVKNIQQKQETKSASKAKPQETQKEKTPDEKLKEANESVAGSFREHGTNSVMHSSDKLNEHERIHKNYVINEPNYDMPPRPVEFKSLKKVYTYFRLKEKLPDEVVEAMNGSLVVMVGAVMPFEKIPEDGKFSTFWLSNPAIVLKGCVFCNPPTLGDIVYAYKDAGEIPFEFDREKLFKQVLLVSVTGRFFFGPDTINGQTFLNSILVKEIKILN